MKRRGDPYPRRSETRKKGRVYVRAVLVGYVGVGQDHVHAVAQIVEGSQAVGEQEERDAPLVVESAYLRRDAERRVVEDQAPLGVYERLVVAAGVERAHYLRALRDAVLLQDPRLDGLVHLGRREAVVGGVLGLELVHELVVGVVLLAHHALQVGEVDGLVLESELGHVDALDLRQFLRQHGVQPFGQVVRPVVRQSVRPHLLLGQPVRHLDGHGLQPQF